MTSTVLIKKYCIVLYSYLKHRKQSVHINNIYSSFLELISVVLQGLVLGILLFNIFPNELLLFIKKTSIHNYADDNTLPVYLSDMNCLIDVLTEESQTTTNWLEKLYDTKSRKPHTWGIKDLYWWRKHRTTKVSKPFNSNVRK